jgi:hypothetical protein
MEDIKIGKGSISIWAIIAAVGGLLAFIAFFLSITKFGADLGILGKHWTEGISGLDFISNKYDGHKVEDAYTFWKIMPLLAMIAGLATIILGILPIFGVNSSGVKVAFMVCGIVTLVLALLVFICTAGTAVLDMSDKSDVLVKRQIGAYFFLIGGILACAGAVCDKMGIKI